MHLTLSSSHLIQNHKFNSQTSIQGPAFTAKKAENKESDSKRKFLLGLGVTLAVLGISIAAHKFIIKPNKAKIIDFLTKQSQNLWNKTKTFTKKSKVYFDDIYRSSKSKLCKISKGIKKICRNQIFRKSGAFLRLASMKLTKRLLSVKKAILEIRLKIAEQLKVKFQKLREIEVADKIMQKALTGVRNILDEVRYLINKIKKCTNKDSARRCQSEAKALLGNTNNSFSNIPRPNFAKFDLLNSIGFTQALIGATGLACASFSEATGDIGHYSATVDNRLSIIKDIVEVENKLKDPLPQKLALKK